LGTGGSDYAIDGGLKLGNVDRLGEMLDKAGSAAALDVFLHTEACKRDSAHRPAGRQLADELKARAVGQANVADEDIERRRRGRTKASATDVAD